MTITRIECSGSACAVIQGKEKVITNAQSALELLMNALAETGTKSLVLPKK